MWWQMNARMYTATVHLPRAVLRAQDLRICPSDLDGRSVECDSHPRDVRRRGRRSERHYLLPGAGLLLGTVTGDAPCRAAEALFA